MLVPEPITVAQEMENTDWPAGSYVRSGLITVWEGVQCCPAWTTCLSLDPTTWPKKNKGPLGILGSPEEKEERILGRQK